jgi:hypothetical protein
MFVGLEDGAAFPILHVLRPGDTEFWRVSNYFPGFPQVYSNLGGHALVVLLPVKRLLDLGIRPMDIIESLGSMQAERLAKDWTFVYLKPAQVLWIPGGFIFVVVNLLNEENLSHQGLHAIPVSRHL